MGLPPQAHHLHGDGVSDVRGGRPAAPAPLSRGERRVPARGVGLPVRRTDVRGGGPGVDPRPEGEAPVETPQLGAGGRMLRPLGSAGFPSSFKDLPGPGEDLQHAGCCFIYFGSIFRFCSLELEDMSLR